MEWEKVTDINVLLDIGGIEEDADVFINIEKLRKATGIVVPTDELLEQILNPYVMNRIVVYAKFCDKGVLSNDKHKLRRVLEELIENPHNYLKIAVFDGRELTIAFIPL